MKAAFLTLLLEVMGKSKNSKIKHKRKDDE